MRWRTAPPGPASRESSSVLTGSVSHSPSTVTTIMTVGMGQMRQTPAVSDADNSLYSNICLK